MTNLKFPEMSKSIGASSIPSRKPMYPGISKVSNPVATHHTNQREMAAKRNGTAKGLSKPKYSGSNIYKHEEDKYEVPSIGGRSKETPSYYESRSQHDLTSEEFEMMKERIATLEKLNRQKDDKIK